MKLFAAVRSPFRLPAFVAILVALLLTVTDLVLLEKKYNLFTGGFLQATQLTGAGERSLFLVVLLLLEMALAGVFYQLALLLGSWRRLPIQLVNYLYVLLYGGISFTMIVVKYQILSYFGDFMSMEVVRNLGGGSLTDAVLYVLNETVLMVVLLVLATVLATWVWRKFLRRWGGMVVRDDRAFRMRCAAKSLLCLFLLVIMVPVAKPLPATKQYLPKVTPYLLARGLMQTVFPPPPSGLPLFVQQHFREFPAQAPGAVHVNFPDRKDNLVLVVAESTRADVIDASVNGQAVAPNWQSLGGEGVIGRQYFSHTGFTVSSLKSIFRGTLGDRLPLGDTLFGLLKAQGYQIIVLSGQDESFGDIARDTRSQATADIYFDAQHAKEDLVFPSAAPGSATLSNARLLFEFDRVADQIDWKRPVFLYVNLQAAHFPYFHPGMPKKLMDKPLARGDISADSKEQLRLTYLNAVAFSDWMTGELVKRLRQREVYQRSLVVVAGDHGESLFDDGVLGHGMRPSDTQLHAMLVANRPVPEFKRLIGQNDLASAMLRSIGADITPAPAGNNQSVLQLIGDMKNPAYLGFKYGDGTRLTIDQKNNEVQANWLAQPAQLDQLQRGTREYREVMELVSRWKKQ